MSQLTGLIDVRCHSRIGTIATMKDPLGKSLHFHASAVDSGARDPPLARPA
jgi:hypothetical protein